MTKWLLSRRRVRQVLAVSFGICCSILNAELAEQSASNLSYKPLSARIERYTSELDELLEINAEIRVLAQGFDWSEGPLWVNDKTDPYLLLSDVPQNKIFKWTARGGITEFMSPSGYAGDNGDFLREPGTNGLIRLDADTIIAADHGVRGLSRIKLADQSKITFIKHFDSKPFNSPNDLVMSSSGQIFFTDPPYGLKGLNRSPYKMLGFNGVFRVDNGGHVVLIDKDLSFPNGIGLSPDGRSLYVANSDPQAPLWKKYVLSATGEVLQSAVFNDASSSVAAGELGLPDGLAVDHMGNIFASGPGGVHIFKPSGKLLGLIRVDRPVSNCTFGGVHGNTLFITADDLLLSVDTKTKGLL